MTPITALFTRNANTAANLESQAPAEGQQNVSNVDDVREAVTVEATAFVASELSRQQEEWRRTFGSVKETLSNLEQAWEAATRKGQDEAQLQGLVEKLVAIAAGKADAAAREAREKADAAAREAREKADAAAREHAEASVREAREKADEELTQVQAIVDRLEAELQTERGNIRSALARIDEEHAALLRAEAARDDAMNARQKLESAKQQLESTKQQLESARQHLESTYEDQLRALKADVETERAEATHLRQQLEAEQSERTRLTAAVQSVQRALSLAEVAPTAAAAPVQAAAPQNHVPPAAAISEELAAEPEIHVIEPEEPAPTRKLELVASTPSDAPEPRPELVEYIRQLLDDVEAMYWADLESARGPSDVVARLTANLKYARDVFARRLEASDAGQINLFERQLMALLDTTSETSFGRHLSFSAYELYPVSDESGRGPRPTPQTAF